MKARHTLGFLGFLGFALVYAMRVNLSVAIVSMVNQTAIPHDDDNDTTDVCRKDKPINGTFIPVSCTEIGDPVCRNPVQVHFLVKLYLLNLNIFLYIVDCWAQESDNFRNVDLTGLCAQVFSYVIFK